MNRWGAAAALVLGCSSPEFTVRAADERLSEPTFRASLAWDEALLRGPCPEVRLIPVGIDATADIVVVVGHDPKGRRAFSDASASTILVDLDRCEASGSNLAAVIAHELGHQLGIPKAEHSPHPDDLMHDTFDVSRGPEPTGYDVAWVCDHW